MCVCGGGIVDIRQYRQVYQAVQSSAVHQPVCQTEVCQSVSRSAAVGQTAVYQSVSATVSGGRRPAAGTAHNNSGHDSTHAGAQCTVSAGGVIARHDGMVCSGSVWYV